MTWLEVANVPLESRVRLNPVKLFAPKGLSPTSPAVSFLDLTK